MKRLSPWTSMTLTLLLVGGCQEQETPGELTLDRNLKSARLRTFDSCEALHGALKSALKSQMRVELERQRDYWNYADDLAIPGVESDGSLAAPAADAQGNAREEGVDFSGTNNQEAGVDEADFVKTDGRFIYLLNANQLRILGVPEFGELEDLSRLDLEGHPFQMLMAEDRAVVFSTVYVWGLDPQDPLRAAVDRGDSVDGFWYGGSAFTKITVVDLADRETPQVRRELYLEGNYLTARRVQSSVRAVTYSWMDIPDLQYWVDYYDYGMDNGAFDDFFSPVQKWTWEQALQETIAKNDRVIDQTELSDFVPAIYEKRGGEIERYALTDQGCQNFARAEDALSRGVSSILTLNLLDDDFSFDSDHVVSNWSTVYASRDTLIIAEATHDWWWFWGPEAEALEPGTNLHRFDIGSADQTVYTGSGRVPGVVRNQFSLSEHKGFIRVATTTGNWLWWRTGQETDNHVFVLGGEQRLREMGHVGGIGRGESIWSARFVGDKAYLVTFRQIDPLWTLDLSNPADPKVIGELEVPGVSTYIHPLGDGRLLTIGYGGESDGLNWNPQVSLFNVQDFAKPRLDSSLSLGGPSAEDGWSSAWSEATHEHKAFQFWAKLGLLAVPVSDWRWYDGGPGGYGYEYYSRLQLVQVTEQGLMFYGDVDHSDYFNSRSGYFWNHTDVRRSIFMGDYVYAISDRGVSAHRLGDLHRTASIPLEGHMSYGSPGDAIVMD